MWPLTPSPSPQGREWPAGGGPGEGLCTRKPLGERWALNQFHHQRADAGGVFQAVDCRNVRVIERSEYLRFAVEARHALCVSCEGFGQNFQGYVTPQLGIARAVDFSHSAHAERRENFVGSEPGSGNERHGVATLYVRESCRGRSLRQSLKVSFRGVEGDEESRSERKCAYCCWRCSSRLQASPAPFGSMASPPRSMCWITPWRSMTKVVRLASRMTGIRTP